MPIAALPSDVFTLLAALFMLFGIPAILFGLIFLYTGYVRYDADRYLEELEADSDGAGPEGAGDAGQEGADGDVEGVEPAGAGRGSGEPGGERDGDDVGSSR